jgi:hypothetical protein
MSSGTFFSIVTNQELVRGMALKTRFVQINSFRRIPNMAMTCLATEFAMDGCGVELGVTVHFHFFRRTRAAACRMYVEHVSPARTCRLAAAAVASHTCMHIF